MGYAPGGRGEARSRLRERRPRRRARGRRGVATRAFYGAKVSAELEFPGADGVLLLLRPTTWAPAEGRAAPPVDLASTCRPRRRAHGTSSSSRPRPPATSTSRRRTSCSRSAAASARRRTSSMFEELAEKMGATLSVSRPLVDAGWMPASRQVGQSGKTVKPTVYLAFGISGAVQHLAGMKTAGTIIAVNTDPEAAIFNVAHYGAVGRPVRRRGRAREALLSAMETRETFAGLVRLADRPLVRADRRLDGDLRLGRRAGSCSSTGAGAGSFPADRPVRPRRPDRADRAHARLDQAPRRRRRARARADLLRLRRALHRDGDPRASRTTSRSPCSAGTSGTGRSTSATRCSSTSSARADRRPR